MAPPEPPSPSASTVLIPFLSNRSRRGSLASINSTKGNIDKDVLAQALDDIHISASRSETLTSFHDYDGGAPRAGAKELVSGGVAGLYDKIRRGWNGQTAVKEGKGRPRSSASKVSIGSKDTADTTSIHSNPSALGRASAIRSPLPDSASVQSSQSGVVSPMPNSSSRKLSRVETDDHATESRSRTSRQMDDADSLTSDSTGDFRADRNSQDTGRAVQDTPTEAEIEEARNALLHDDHSESATQALALVLSYQDMEIAENQRGRHFLQTTIEGNGEGSASERLSSAATPTPANRAISEAELRDTSQPVSAVAGDLGAKRPPMVKVGVSHLPGFDPSRPSSIDGREEGSVGSHQQEKPLPKLEPSPNINTALQRKRHHESKPASSAAQPLNHVPTHLKRRVISKAFWMKDENAKDCFYCGQPFSTFRRKHHCRTCGQIFDAKCTTLVAGRPFGQPGSIRLCKPCEAMIYGSDDDSTVFSEDGEDHPRSPHLRWSTREDDDVPWHMEGLNDGRKTTDEVTTPSIGIPASRRNREAKRRSAVIEFDAAPALPRPTSSHSLISLARRPRSSSHRRQQSRQQNLRAIRANAEDRGPFHPGSIDSHSKKASLPAFHNDNIIDPDLAPFASDEGSDEEEAPSIFAAMNDMNGTSPGEREKMGFGVLLSSAVKKGRSRLGTISSVRGGKDDDALHQATKHLPKLSRNRNPSIGSLSFGRPSPRRSRSTNLLKTAVEGESFDHQPITPTPDLKPCGTKLVRSSAMRGRGAPPMELNRASLEHVRRLLAQLLKDSNIPNVTAWEKALIPILLQCTDDVKPNVQEGDDMDIRHYVKLKKVPGGRPGDTSYVSGIMFSKNVALKSMPRSISRPRIAIVSFAIEYARHKAHFMSLDPVIAQEEEYLRNLVGRIVALGPSVLLVQKHVSGLALHLLETAGITVAYNIKESVLAAVARVTASTVIKSVDKLAIDPSHLGRCESFEVKTYVHEGVRKSYIYLSGCQPELGCTIVLRGIDSTKLRKIKRITEFMCYVAYNLKLETSLMRDEFVAIPTSAKDKLEAEDTTISKPSAEYVPILPYTEHGESVRVPEPPSSSDRNTPSTYERLEEQSKARILSASPFVVFMQPYLLTQLRESERRLTTYKHLRDQYAAADQEGDEDEKDTEENHFSIVRPEDVHAAPSKHQPKAVRDYLHAVHEAQLEKTKHTYDTQRRLFDSFMAAHSNLFDPYCHQNIVVLHSTVSMINSAPCAGPELVGIGFYAGLGNTESHFEDDCTLGQFIEDMCDTSSDRCKDCDKKMSDHHKQYVHGYGQLSISVGRQAAKMRGYSKTILMWAICRICKQETTVTPMSENTWKYSFAKYLELSFWSSPLHPRAGICQHDIHKDFLRCFGFEDMVVRVQYDPVEIYDVVVPRTTITWKVESDLTVKNEQFSLFVQRLNAFTDSIRKRLDSINVDTLDEKKAEEAHERLDELRSRAEADHEELLGKLESKYSKSRYYEVIPLNRALRFMDEKALAWDDIFNDFERDYFPSETDIRKLATLQLRNMFLESQPTPNISASDVSDNEDGVELTSVPQALSRQLTQTVLHSAKAQDVLSNTVEEHRAAMGDTNGTSTSPTTIVEEAPDASLTATLSREEQEHAVQSPEVNHLDLAVPSSSESVTESRNSQEDPAKEHSRPLTHDSNDDEETFATSKLMGSKLLERIEQIRQSRGQIAEDLDNTESRIPRLARAPSPKPSAPPLLRAQSSPTHIKHLSEHSIDSVLDEIARVDNMQIDKRPGERLGMQRLANKVSKVAPSLIPRSILHRAEDMTNNSVSALARHFEQMSREFEKERLKERRQRALRSRQARANPLASSKPVVEVYRDAKEAVGERTADPGRAETMAKEQTAEQQAALEHESPDHSQHSLEDPPLDSELRQQREGIKQEERLDLDSEADGGSASSDIEPSEPPRRPFDSIPMLSPPPLLSPTTSAEMDLSPDLSIPEHKKNVWFKYLAEFWSKRSASGWANLEYPLHATEHVFEDSDIIVREDEPSSVIALSLSSADYLNKVQEFRSHPKKSKSVKQQAYSNSTVYDSLSEEGPDQKDIEASLLSDTGTHMKYSFAHGAVKASCKIFYAESFDALRRRCNVADRFVESLSRCLKFDSKGGKTKSIFLKTVDNRFMIKSLQEVELKAFTKFAPDYFAFMSYTLFHGVPSVIAKMFGLFQVIIKNPATGMDFSYYLLVMENLFYERNPNRRFDLKGSMRNRKIESTGQPDEVLLDENLVETIFESPLFVREHARKLMQASVWNDTMWLCKQNVMDYSLMAGFDDERKELVVGIIDCIRTYTWDKKLESWIKDRGKNKPTITSPKDYRNRFRVSMMQYVLQAPSCWHQFQAQVAMPKRLGQGGRDEREGIETDREEKRTREEERDGTA